MSSAIAFVIVLVIYSHAYLYLWSKQILNVMPGLWYLAIVGIGVVGGLMSFIKRRHSSEFNPKLHRLNQRVLAVWSVIFLACATFSFLFSDRLEPQLRALKTAVICVGLLLVFMAAFGREREVRAARLGMLVVVLISVLNNILDFTGIFSFSLARGRAAGFYENPNISGFYLVIGMVLTAALVPRRWRLYYCLLVGAGVTLTFSRSSVLMWLVGLYGLSQAHLFHFSRRTLTLMWTCLVAMVLFAQFGEGVVESLGLGEYLTEDARSRVQFNFQTDESVQGRLSVAEKSWALIKQAPWSGHGLGAHEVWRTQVSPHNMFLLIGVEMGALGLMLYTGLLIVLWRMNAGIVKVFVSVFFVGSLFSHNLLDQTALWLALAVLVGVAAIQSEPVARRTRLAQFPSAFSRQGGGA